MNTMDNLKGWSTDTVNNVCKCFKKKQKTKNNVGGGNQLGCIETVGPAHDVNDTE